MTSPCQAGQSCPEIEKAKLQMYREFERMIRSMRDELAPMVTEVLTAGKDIAAHSEKLNAGAERFAGMEKNIDDLFTRTDSLQQWRDTQDGKEKATIAAARTAGQIWAAVISVVGLVLQIIYFHFSRRG